MLARLLGTGGDDQAGASTPRAEVTSNTITEAGRQAKRNSVELAPGDAHPAGRTELSPQAMEEVGAGKAALSEAEPVDSTERTLLVHVVNALGDPISVWPQLIRKRGRSWRALDSVERVKSAKGIYSLTFPRGVLPAYLVGQSSGAGTGSVPWGSAEEQERERGYVTLTIGGAGVLHGRIVDREGRALGGMRFRAVRTELLGEKGLGSRYDVWESVIRSAGRPSGLEQEGFRTDADGRFRLRGLREGAFTILPYSRAHRYRDVPSKVIAAPGSPAVLVRISRPLLEVRIDFSGIGEPSVLETASVSVYEPGGRASGPTRRPRVSSSVYQSAKTGPKRTVFFEVQAGRSYGLMLEHDWGQSQPAFAHVDVPEDAARVLVDLAIPGPQRSVAVQVYVDLAPSKRPEAGLLGSVMVYAVDETTGICVTRLPRHRIGSGPVELELAPGRYEIVAEGTPSFSSPARGGPQGAVHHGEARQSLVVHDADSLEVTLALPLGGHLRIEIDPASSVGEGEPVSLWARSLDSGRTYELESLRGLATRNGDATRSGSFIRRPGDEFVTRALPAGEYVVYARHDPDVELARAVAKAGETTVVRVP